MGNNSSNHLAPVIYIAESPEQVMNYKWYENSKYLNQNVLVLEPEAIRKLGEGNENFYLPYDLTPGEVLLRHPYNQGYIAATDAEDEYLSASVEGIFLVARCLGATKITYSRCNIGESIRKLDSNNGMKYKVVELNVDVKKSMEQKILNKWSMTREFPKSDFSSVKFEKAKSIASERGLLLSKDVKSLLDARNPEFGEPMIRQTVKAEISSSLNKALDIAFSINAVSVFNLSSNTKNVTQKKVDLNIEWEIVF